MTETTQGNIDGIVRLIRLLRKGSDDGSTCLCLSDAKTKGSVPENNLDYAFTIQFEHVLKKRNQNGMIFGLDCARNRESSFQRGFQIMNSKAPRKKIPVKTIFHHVIRAKLYAVLTMNALEGMMLEINTVLTPENGSREVLSRGCHS